MMTKPLIAILLLATLIGCAKHTIDPELLCRRWVMDDSDIPSYTEFHSDGRVSVVYEQGTDLEGTWYVAEDGTISISIRDWQMTGRFEDEKLIIRNQDREQSYSELRE